MIGKEFVVLHFTLLSLLILSCKHRWATKAYDAARQVEENQSTVLQPLRRSVIRHT